jgi:3D (Asp-Asp-Asp) domain-containing protein
MSFTAVFTSSAQTKRKVYSNKVNHHQTTKQVVLESSDSYYLNKDLIRNAKRMRVGATAYCNDPITFTGTVPEVGRTIAVDPNVIPLGSKVYIPQFNRVFIAEDTGGKIKGLRIDVYMEDYDTCMNWGFKDIDIYILNN